MMLLVLTSSSDGVQLRSCNRGTFLLFLPLLFLLNPKQVHTAEDAAPQCSSNTSDDADEGLGWRENATYDDNQPFPPLPVLLLPVFIFYFISSRGHCCIAGSLILHGFIDAHQRHATPACNMPILDVGAGSLSLLELVKSLAVATTPLLIRG